MKKKSPFLILFIIPLFSALAQDKVVVKITNEGDANQLLSSSRFLFSQFEDARVYIRGSNINTKMNYNLLMDRMQFIDENGDTLIMTDNKAVTVVMFGKRPFKYSPKGFVEVLVVDSPNSTELSIKRSIKLIDRKKTGPYGIKLNSSSVNDLYSTGQDAGEGLYKIATTAEELSFIRKNIFYLSTNDKYTVANRKGFMKTYAKQKNEITDYLKRFPVDFEKEEDIARLFDFCKKASL